MSPKDRLPRRGQFEHDVQAALKRIERVLAAHGAILEAILARLAKPSATHFGFSARNEPISQAAKRGKEDAMPPTPFPGPVPPGHRVIVTVTAKGDDGNPAAIDGDFQATRDDDGDMTVTELTPKTVWDVACNPPADNTHDTTVSVMDSDNTPADSFTIDWDGPVVVPQATNFGFAVRTEPIV